VRGGEEKGGESNTLIWCDLQEKEGKKERGKKERQEDGINSLYLISLKRGEGCGKRKVKGRCILRPRSSCVALESGGGGEKKRGITKRPAETLHSLLHIFLEERRGKDKKGKEGGRIRPASSLPRLPKLFQFGRIGEGGKKRGGSLEEGKREKEMFL